ncbi:MAG: Histidine--tRNA ligase [Parcubacteria group bacterium]|nr:Histidine--tRNA ligase [Parcubacteria group bacterium]
MSKQTNRPGFILNEFDRSVFLASHFGFMPVEAPKVTEKDLRMTEECRGFVEADKPKGIHDAAEKSAFLRTYLEKEWNGLSHPLALAYKKPDSGKKTSEYGLHVLGLSTAAAEALLLQASLSILEDQGHKHMVIEINSMGDKDSISAYERELHHFMKKHGDCIASEHKKRLKTDILEILNIELPEASRDQLPLSIASLNSVSRAHFKEMLEYLEALNVEFRLAHTLNINKHYASHTIYSIRDLDNESLLAKGCRYSRLSKRFGFKKELPAAAITIFGEVKEPLKMYKDLPRPKFHLIQLGSQAKLKAIPLIELLRREKIPVYHAIGRDKITAQFSSAEALRVPYVLIVGQKEALDNTVTIRNSFTRAQETVRMDVLPQYLKNLTF